MPQGSEPQVHAQRHEQGGRNQLRGYLVAVERSADPIFRITLDQPARRAEHAAERASGHQSGSDDHAALAYARAVLAAERSADPIFRIPLDQPARRAEHAAERASGHQSGSDDHAALAYARAVLAALAIRALAEVVRQKAAHQRGRV